LHRSTPRLGLDARDLLGTAGALADQPQDLQIDGVDAVGTAASAWCS